MTSEEGVNRKVRNALTYPKIRAGGPDAVRLKLADRLANVRNGEGSAKIYAKEYGDFRHALRDERDTLNTLMWAALDDAIDRVDGIGKWEAIRRTE